MRKDLLLIGFLIALAFVPIGILVAIQMLRPEEDDSKRVEVTKPSREFYVDRGGITWKQPTPTLAPAQPHSRTNQPEADAPKTVAPTAEFKPAPTEEIAAKFKPKLEAAIEAKKIDDRPPSAKVIVLGNDIKLNDPDGDYSINTINGGERVVVQGKIKTLRVAGLNEKSTLDTTLLEAGEIVFTGNVNGATVLLGKAHTLKMRDLNDHAVLDGSILDARDIVMGGGINGASKIKLHAPAGNVKFSGEINDRAQIDIAAPAGKVRFQANINGADRINITASSVELAGDVNGAKTVLDATLTNPGVLSFRRLNGSVRLHYRKADAGDPDIRITRGAVGGQAEFREK